MILKDAAPQWVGLKVLEKMRDGIPSNTWWWQRCLQDKRLRMWCMLATPFIAFYVIGTVLQSNLDYLVKFGILVFGYLAVHIAGKLVFDDRLMNVLPMGLYLATKVSVSFTNISEFIISSFKL